MKRAATFYATLAAIGLALLAFPTKGQAQFPRTTLIEEFTSNTCKPCTTATPIINNIVKQSGGRVVSIRYHLNFPLPGDPWYAANMPQNNTRKTYYGATSLPYGRLDGATTVSVTEEGEVQDKVASRLEQESPIKIQVTQTREGNKMNVQVVVTAGENGMEGGNFKLHVVAVESKIHNESFQQEPYNKETDFYDVMRMMIPGPEGSDITMSPDEKKTLNFSYDIGNDWQADEMYTVAFVQNDVSKQIMQTGFSAKAASVPTAPLFAGYALSPSFPNPAGSSATINYTLGAPEQVTVALYSMTGERVMSLEQGSQSAGSHALPVDLASLPAGLYTVSLTAGNFHAAGMLTVVR